MEVPMEATTVTCHACGKAFAPRFSFQREQRGDQVVWLCSQACKLAGVTAPAAQVTCATCGAAFTPERAIQVADSGDGRVYYCTLACRQAASGSRPASTPQRRLAVINGRIVREGDSVEGYRITRIRQEDVVVTGANRSWRVEFDLQQR